MTPIKTEASTVTPAVGPSVASRGPDRDCRLCERLAQFRDANAAAEPGWFNAPVPTFGSMSSRVLIVGLAPGLRGANRTGRPFTGDYAGDLLYATLLDHGFAEGRYEKRPDDGLTLNDCVVTNAVRCVPPQNKPLPKEIATCRPFLRGCIDAMDNLRVIVALGRIAHESVLRALGERLAAAPFAHARRHELRGPAAHPIALIDSYHCSRYNTNTGVLTEAMFQAVFAAVRERLREPARLE
jgi:uracil-DNA glycosylase family 4